MIIVIIRSRVLRVVYVLINSKVTLLSASTRVCIVIRPDKNGSFEGWLVLGGACWNCAQNTMQPGPISFNTPKQFTKYTGMSYVTRARVLTEAGPPLCLKSVDLPPPKTLQPDVLSFIEPRRLAVSKVTISRSLARRYRSY